MRGIITDCNGQEPTLTARVFPWSCSLYRGRHKETDHAPVRPTDAVLQRRVPALLSNLPRHKYNHCLKLGGAHAPEHIQLMQACAEIYRASAQVMIIGSPHHKHLCAECANECERIGDMDDCVKACRSCAESCRKMAT